MGGDRSDGSPASRYSPPLDRVNQLGRVLQFTDLGAITISMLLEGSWEGSFGSLSRRTVSHYIEVFYTEVRKYWPNLPDGSLLPDYAGIRPKIRPATQAGADFVIQGASAHGIEGLVNLFGIESPGLTSALAIADKVLGLVEHRP